MTQNPISTTIHIKHINPKTYKKFRKYLQKKYKTKKIKEEYYNTELNKALTMYMHVIQLQEIDLAKQFIKLGEADTYALF